MSRRLIVNADDLGRTSGVTEGILRAHREGIVTSTTAMMNYGGAAALARAREECPELGLGIHLVFSSGRPLMPPEWVPSLVDERGFFISQDALMSDPERVDLRELESELKAQIKTFQNATGGLPDHVDAHHFVHLLPRFFELYLDLAAQFKLPVRLPLLPEGEAVPSSLARLPGLAVRDMAAADRALAQAKDVRGPDRLLFFASDDCLRLPYLLDLLKGLPEGTSELMVHPGLADETLRAQSSYAEQRERELALLCSPSLRRAIAGLEIELVTFASLAQ